MSINININADMAEGFGAYDIGNDFALLDIIKSANIACGFHAGDPTIMHRVVKQANQIGVSIGAHPGYNDLWGFGRRKIEMNPQDLEYAVAYQIGALQAIAATVGEKVTHLKPHGALNNFAAVNEEAALAIGRAIKAVDPDIIYVVLSGSEMERAAENLNLVVAREGFPDRMYDDFGNLISRSILGAVITDPLQAAEQALRMVMDSEIISLGGHKIKRKIDSLCIHGDEATSFIVASEVRDRLETAGVNILSLPELLLN